jgi:type III secretory pathway component EscU
MYPFHVPLNEATAAVKVKIIKLSILFCLNDGSSIFYRIQYIILFKSNLLEQPFDIQLKHTLERKSYT